MPYEPKSSHFYFVALYRKTLSVPELQEHSYFGIKKTEKKLKEKNKKSQGKKKKLGDAFTTPDMRASSQSTQQEVSMGWKKK